MRDRLALRSHEMVRRVEVSVSAQNGKFTISKLFG